jgi:histidinol-phosphate/aromatic aminotransferase/cobyric acid decarboxylase-like protein
MRSNRRSNHRRVSLLAPAAVDASPAPVSLGVMSKTFALAGLRIGWVACRDRRLLARLAAFKDYTTICSSAPSEVLSFIALGAVDRIVERSRDRRRQPTAGRRRLRAERRALRLGAPVRGPDRIPPTAVGGINRALLRRACSRRRRSPRARQGLRPTGNHFRIGFGRRNFPEALQRLDRFIDGRPRAGSRAA